MSTIAIGLGILFGGVYVGTFVVEGGLQRARNWYLFFAMVSFFLFMALRVNTCLMIFFAYLSVEGMLKLLTNYHPIVHIGADIILFFILVRWVGNKIITGEPFERTPYFGLIALHSFWIMIQVFNPYSLGLIPSLGSFKVHLTMIPLFFLGYSVMEEERDLKAFIALQCFLGFVVWGTAMQQYIQGPDSIAWLGPTAQEKLWQFGDFFFRPFGTTATPGAPSNYGLIVLPFLVTGFWIWRSWLARVMLSFLVILGVATLFVCQVRQVFILSVVAVFLVVMLAPRSVIGRGIAVTAMAGMGMIAYVMSQLLGGLVVMARFLTLLQSQTYLRSREGSLETALYNAIHFPFGAGMGRVGAAADKFKLELAQNPVPVKWSDTFPGMMISEAGVPALLFLSLILLLMVFHAFLAVRRTEGEIPRLMAVAIFSLLLIYIPFSVGANPIMGNPYTAYFWFLGGLAMKLSHVQPKPQKA
jgi:hypothetical protein